MSKFKVILQNLSPSYPQSSWISMGIPASYASNFDGYQGIVKAPGSRGFEGYIRGQELFVKASLDKNEKVVGEFIPTSPNENVFSYSPWVSDDLSKLIPSFSIKDDKSTSSNDVSIFNSIPLVFWDGAANKPEAYIYCEEDLDIRKRYFFHTRIKEASITIEGWFDVYSDQESIPMIIRSTYGTVNSEKILNRPFGSLSMFLGEKPIIDFSKAKGLHPVIWRNDLSCWEIELASPRVWWKARTIESFGAVLAMPAYDKIAEIALSDPNFYTKIANLKAREEAPALGIADLWENNWMAFGKVPDSPAAASVEINRLYSNMLGRLRTMGDEYNPRDFAQPPNSGQTGEQPDFGASKCELAVSLKQPWSLWDYRFSVQAWMLRPYSHRDSNGYPIKAVDHPDAHLYNLAVDSRFSEKDMLGFPNPIPYNEFWTGSDGQHRSDNLLLGLYALTRDPSIRQTILDLVECQKMEIRPWRMYPPQGSIESPRGWGRPLMSLANLMHLGFTDVKDYLVDMVDTMYNNAALRALPNDNIHTVRTLSRHGFKYGWVDGSNKQIEAWVCWEESIAVMGLWAAYKVTGDLRAKELALEIARTITRHAFFKAQDSNWYACYCVKFNTVDYGIPIQSTSYNLEPNNKEVVVYGMQRWMLPSLKILVASSSSTDPVAMRAKEIISFFGTQPADLYDAGWWAV